MFPNDWAAKGVFRTSSALSAALKAKARISIPTMMRHVRMKKRVIDRDALPATVNSRLAKR